MASGAREDCFAAFARRTSRERALERFPLDYSRFVKAQASLGHAKAVVRRHPELVVLIDSSDPAQSGVTIARLLWDKMLDRSVGELRQVRRDSHVDMQKCHAGVLVETVENIAIPHEETA